MVGSEVYSSEVKKTEVLMENFRCVREGWGVGRSGSIGLGCGGKADDARTSTPNDRRAIGLRIKENKEVYEGEVGGLGLGWGGWMVWGVVWLSIASQAARCGLMHTQPRTTYNQVTELTPEETENPLGGYGRTVAHVVIGLKTTKGSKQLRLDPSIYESLQKEGVSVGDVIYIEANSGAVKRVGRSDAFATEFDLEVSGPGGWCV